MLKNKMIVKKIRNIFILLMAIIIMLGAYHNIRNSKAENVIQIELEVSDKSNTLSAQTVTIDATETSDGNYLLNLPISVNKNLVTKYYTSNGEEIVVDTENNIATLQLTDEEVQNKKVQVQTDYDTKEVTVNNETKLFYKKELTNEPLIEEQESQKDQNTTTNGNEETDESTVNQDVVVTGYMPEDAKLEVKEVDLATLTNVKVPNDKQTMKKAYEISIYQIVEKKSDEKNETSIEEQSNSTAENTTSTDTTNTDVANSDTANAKEQNDGNGENIETERIEYDPSVYEEKITIKTKFDQTNVNTTVYMLGENNEITEVESTSSENKEDISFETEKADKSIKYIMATEEKPEETNTIDDTTTDESDTNTEDTSSNSEKTDVMDDIENSDWKVVDSNTDISSGKSVVKIKGPKDILTEDCINVIINGEIANDEITKKISEKQKVSDGIQYTITITGLKNDVKQIKIGLIDPKSMGVQTLSMADEVSSDEAVFDEATSDEAISDGATTNDTSSDESGIMLLETTYNTIKSASSETSATSKFLGGPSSIQRQNIQKVEFSNSMTPLGRKLMRNFNASNNTGTSHSNNTTTWKDLTGTANGTLKGRTYVGN